MVGGRLLLAALAGHVRSEVVVVGYSFESVPLNVGWAGRCCRSWVLRRALKEKRTAPSALDARHPVRTVRTGPPGGAHRSVNRRALGALPVRTDDEVHRAAAL